MNNQKFDAFLKLIDEKKPLRNVFFRLETTEQAFLDACNNWQKKVAIKEINKRRKAERLELVEMLAEEMTPVYDGDDDNPAIDGDCKTYPLSIFKGCFIEEFRPNDKERTLDGQRDSKEFYLAFQRGELDEDEKEERPFDTLHCIKNKMDDYGIDDPNEMSLTDAEMQILGNYEGLPAKSNYRKAREITLCLPFDEFIKYL